MKKRGSKMVYFMIDDFRIYTVKVVDDGISIKREYVDIDSSVKGLKNKSSKAVMDLITNVAKQFTFYKLKDNEIDYKLERIRYAFMELARPKIYLTTIPEDTYRCLAKGEKYKFGDNIGINDVVDIYVDVGSPFKRFYTISREENPEIRDPNLYEFQINGYPKLTENYQTFHIRIDMAPDSWRPKTWKKAYEKRNVLFIDFNSEISEETLKLLKTALDLHQKETTLDQKKMESDK
jgi:nitrogen regulatory protein PII-like uncharacterized protein